MRYFFLLLALFAPLSVSAEPHTLRVVASFSILGDMVREVGGDDITLTTLVGPDGDAHTYEPAARDAKILANADVLIVNGLGFETWLARLIDSSGFKGSKAIATTGIIPLTFAQGETDPHAWQDVANGIVYVANIEAALAKADPAHAQAYAARANAYTLKLKTLDNWVRTQMATLPASKRRAITTHDALGYFAHAYGVTFLAPLGVSTAGEPTAGDIGRIIDQIRAQHIRAIFLENMSDPRLANQLARDGGAIIGGTLYSDAISPPTGPAPDYIALFRYNVKTMWAAMAKNK